MGLAPVPRKFTKLTKPILAHLHDLGHVITSFIDDSLLVGQTEEDIVHSVTDTIKVFDSLGFVIHEEKSRFMPTQQITYLGFEINSCDMSITLTTERKHKLREASGTLEANKGQNQDSCLLYRTDGRQLPSCANGSIALQSARRVEEKSAKR